MVINDLRQVEFPVVFKKKTELGLPLSLNFLTIEAKIVAPLGILNVLAIRKLLKVWWPGTESNRRRRPFQGRLPNRGSGLKSTDLIDYNELTRPAL